MVASCGIASVFSMEPRNAAVIFFYGLTRRGFSEFPPSAAVAALRTMAPGARWRTGSRYSSITSSFLVNLP